MKKQWIIICIVIAVVFVSVGTVLLLLRNNLPFDNTTDKHDLITVTYPVSEIENLKNTFKDRESNNREYKFSEFKMNYEAECIRKSFGGYYVILLLDNDSEAYVFFNENLEMFNVMIFDRFLSVEDFETLYRLTDILELDPNAERLAASTLIYVHIVQEGVLQLRYKTNWDSAGENVIEGLEELEQYLEEHPDEFYMEVVSRQFWKNSELNGEEYFIGRGSAYILPIDKTKD